MVKTSTDGKPVVVPGKFVADVTEKKAAEIGRKLGGTVKAVKQKPVEKPTTAAQTGKSSGGLIAGVVVAVGIVVIIAAFTIRYFRYETYMASHFCAESTHTLDLIFGILCTSTDEIEIDIE